MDRRAPRSGRTAGRQRDRRVSAPGRRLGGAARAAVRTGGGGGGTPAGAGDGEGAAERHSTGAHVACSATMRRPRGGQSP